MFDQFDKPAAPMANDPATPPKTAEDIFDNVDQGNFNPLTSAKPAAFEAIVPQSPASQNLDFEPGIDSASKNKKYITILLSVIGGLVVITAGTLFALSKMKIAPVAKQAADQAAVSGQKSQEKTEVKTPVTQEVKSNNSIGTEALLNASTTSGTESQAVAPAVIAVDTDQDGLTDAEEAKLGTDPAKKDTDSDGLSDYDEVKIYATDPLNPDSDGDTYKDGEEVSKGYNPHGKGKLFDVTGQVPLIKE